jgi:hypothetical protein
MIIGSRDFFPEGGSMQSKTHAIVVIALLMGLMAGCGTGSVSKEERDTLIKQAQASRQEWNKVDPQFAAFAKKGYGYASSRRSPKVVLSLAGLVVRVWSMRRASTSVTPT